MVDKVKEIIADKLDKDVAEITLEASFVDDLDADSLSIMELVMALEEELDIHIEDEDIEKFVTVGDVVTFVEEHQ